MEMKNEYNINSVQKKKFVTLNSCHFDFCCSGKKKIYCFKKNFFLLSYSYLNKWVGLSARF